MAQIDIIMPLYNKARTVARAIRSIQGQTMTDWRLIVVDDGSTDAGPEIVRRLADPRTTLFSQPNQGPGAARNAGLHRATAELVSFLDADDEYYPWYLKNILRAFMDTEVNFATNFYYEWPSQTDLMVVFTNLGLQPGKYRIEGGEDPRLVVRMISATSIYSVLRKSILSKYGDFFEGKKCVCGEDKTLFMRILFNEVFQIIAPSAVRYHREDSSLTSVRKIPPVAPYLQDPDLFLSYCPTEKLVLGKKVLNWMALHHATALAALGCRIEAEEILKNYPEARQFEQEFSCFEKYQNNLRIINQARAVLGPLKERIFNRISLRLGLRPKAPPQPWE